MSVSLNVVISKFSNEMWSMQIENNFEGICEAFVRLRSVYCVMRTLPLVDDKSKKEKSFKN